MWFLCAARVHLTSACAVVSCSACVGLWLGPSTCVSSLMAGLCCGKHVSLAVVLVLHMACVCLDGGFRLFVFSLWWCVLCLCVVSCHTVCEVCCIAFMVAMLVVVQLHVCV
jgi:hypothetical protein